MMFEKEIWMIPMTGPPAVVLAFTLLHLNHMVNKSKVAKFGAMWSLNLPASPSLCMCTLKQHDVRNFALHALRAPPDEQGKAVDSDRCSDCYSCVPSSFIHRESTCRCCTALSLLR